MFITLRVWGKNKETQERELFDLKIHKDDIACLYGDRYGVAVSMLQGKIYRVEHTIVELQEII